MFTLYNGQKVCESSSITTSMEPSDEKFLPRIQDKSLTGTARRITATIRRNVSKGPSCHAGNIENVEILKRIHSNYYGGAFFFIASSSLLV